MQHTTENNTQTRRISVLLIGPGGVGKTAYARLLQTGGFKPSKEPTENAVSYTLTPWKVTGGHGHVEFTLREINSLPQDRLDKTIEGAEGVIAMYDLQQEEKTAADVEQMYHILTGKAKSDMPIALCGNKTDLVTFRDPGREEDASSSASPTIDPIATYRILQHWKEHISPHTSHYYISAKSSYQLEKPLLHIASCVLNDPALGLE